MRGETDAAESQELVVKLFDSRQLLHLHRNGDHGQYKNIQSDLGTAFKI